jgi:prolyl oligopeptidase
MGRANDSVAVACIRGGGEYGKAWHDVAVGINRSISFEDLAYAARYLHSSGLSTPSLTSIYGISNGGLLVAACANRNPELYGAVFCDVGVLDLTRFHKFVSSTDPLQLDDADMQTLGRLWTAEYGDPDNKEHLPIIHASSPYHNIQPTLDYPAILVTTGDHDTRVIPGHSLKYIAQLQSTSTPSSRTKLIVDLLPNNKNVFLARIYENAGHECTSPCLAKDLADVLAASKSVAQRVEEAVDRLVFVLSTISR